MLKSRQEYALRKRIQERRELAQARGKVLGQRISFKVKYLEKKPELETIIKDNFHALGQSQIKLGSASEGKFKKSQLKSGKGSRKEEVKSSQQILNKLNSLLTIVRQVCKENAFAAKKFGLILKNSTLFLQQILHGDQNEQLSFAVPSKILAKRLNGLLSRYNSRLAERLFGQIYIVEKSVFQTLHQLKTEASRKVINSTVETMRSYLTDLIREQHQKKKLRQDLTAAQKKRKRLGLLKTELAGRKSLVGLGSDLRRLGEFCSQDPRFGNGLQRFQMLDSCYSRLDSMMQVRDRVLSNIM